MKKRIVAIILCCLILSSCSFEIGTEGLLSPPMITKEQMSINDAISSAVGSNDFHLIFPQNGTHHSACTLFDIDGDSLNEAIAFYELTSNEVTSTWICILKQTDDGKWIAVKQIPGETNMVDRVEFVNIADKDESSIFVGWKNSGSPTAQGYFYNLEGGNASNQKSFAYSDMVVADINHDGKQEVMILDLSSAVPKMSLIQGTTSGIVPTSEVTLPSTVTGLTNISAGLIADGLNAILCDVTLSSNKIDTIIAAIVDEPISKIELISPPEITSFNSFERTQQSAVCVDYNKDGLLDIPIEETLKGYEKSTNEEKIFLTRYYSIIDGSFTQVGRVIINEKSGYTIHIPSSWDDNVTIFDSSLQNEWILKYYNGSIGIDNTNEIMAIKTRSISEYQDVFEAAIYHTCLTRGATEYQIRLPDLVPLGYDMDFETAAELITLN